METSGSPKISVITACFNHGKYITEMIESLLVQTFRDFEIIIVNDGSTDDSWEVIKAWEQENITVINSDHNGPSTARNIATQNAKASIILNLDADDKIAPDLLEKAYNVFLQKDNVGIVYSDCEFFGARKKKFYPGEYNLKSMLRNNRIISAAFYRKRDWELVGGYSDSFLYGLEDWDLWLNIISLGRDVVKVSDSLVFYRTYSNPAESRSGSRKADRTKSRYSKLLIYRRHMDLYSLYPGLGRYFFNLMDPIKDENINIMKLRDLVFRYKQKINNYLS